MLLCSHGISNSTNDHTTNCRTSVLSTRTTVLAPRGASAPLSPKPTRLPLAEDGYLLDHADASGEDVPGAADVSNCEIDDCGRGDQGVAEAEAAASAGGRSNVSPAGSSDSSESLGESLVASSLSDEHKAPKHEIYVDAELCPLVHLSRKMPAALKPLTLMDVWVVDVPAIHTVTIFDFAKRHNIHDHRTAHLKRVKRSQHASSVTVLLCSVAADNAADTTIASLVASDSLVAHLGPFTPYRMSVPATQAESTGQLSQWGSIWPITYIPLHAGPRGHLLPRRWTREHVDWARKGLQRVGRLAAEATAKGELPIACMVANNFDPRQADLDPVELTYSQDTRTSTGNTLCHAYRNLIASVADLDRRGVRSGPLTPPTARGATLPYLLTGMTLFATHEPCLLCSMALLHSRVQYLVYAVASPGAGGCGSVYDVHEDEGLNHKFEVWHWREFVDGLTVVEVDP